MNSATTDSPLTEVTEEAVTKESYFHADKNEGSRAYRMSRKSRKCIGWTRFMALVPAVGLFISALALTITTLISTLVITFQTIVGDVTIQDMLVSYIEYADFFLMAIVLYIMSIGLYSLFIDDNVEMPDWLEIHDLDDLKEKLIAIIAVVMAVYFLGRLIHGASAMDVILLGIGIGAVIMSLAYFVKHVIGGKHR